MTAPAPDDEARDEQGLTRFERAEWRKDYTAIAEVMRITVEIAPTPAEARRRIAILRLELRILEAAVDIAARLDNPPPPKDLSHGQSNDRPEG